MKSIEFLNTEAKVHYQIMFISWWTIDSKPDFEDGLITRSFMDFKITYDLHKILKHYAYHLKFIIRIRSLNNGG